VTLERRVWRAIARARWIENEDAMTMVSSSAIRGDGAAHAWMQRAKSLWIARSLATLSARREINF